MLKPNESLTEKIASDLNEIVRIKEEALNHEASITKEIDFLIQKLKGARTQLTELRKAIFN